INGRPESSSPKSGTAERISSAEIRRARSGAPSESRGVSAAKAGKGLMDWHSADAIVSLFAKIASTIGGLIAVFLAIFVYNRNSRVRRAEWLASLYEKFYEKPELRDIREILDCDAGDSNETTAVLESERRDFTA